MRLSGRPAPGEAPVAIHVALTAVMGWLAIVLIVPGDTFASSPTFHVMASIAAEERWAMVFWGAASVGLAGLTTSSRLVRLVSVLLVSTMHGIVALCFVLANPVTTGTGTYSIIAGLGYYLAWRRTREGL